jgi:hypothetical protein
MDGDRVASVIISEDPVPTQKSRVRHPRTNLDDVDIRKSDLILVFVYRCDGHLGRQELCYLQKRAEGIRIKLGGMISPCALHNPLKQRMGSELNTSTKDHIELQAS